MPCLGHCPLWLLANEPIWISQMGDVLHMFSSQDKAFMCLASTPVASLANEPAFVW